MPMNLDRRACSDDDIEELSPAQFFTDRFPSLAESNGHLLAAATHQLGTRPLTIEVEQGAWTIAPDRETVRVVPSRVDDALVVRFTPAEFSAWCQNQRTFNSFLVDRSLQAQGGDQRDISIWDSLVL